MNKILDTLCGFGHPVNEDADNDIPLVMKEISICGSSDAIRLVAEFLNHAADRMDVNPAFDHSHLCDHIDYPDLRKRFDIVICKV